jgi:hypothetical protein
VTQTDCGPKDTFDLADEKSGSCLRFKPTAPLDTPSEVKYDKSGCSLHTVIRIMARA